MRRVPILLQPTLSTLTHQLTADDFLSVQKFPLRLNISISGKCSFSTFRASSQPCNACANTHRFIHGLSTRKLWRASCHLDSQPPVILILSILTQRAKFPCAYGCCCCCCDSPAALLPSSVIQVEEVCDRSRVVPQVLHCELRRMALTVEQMLYGVWCHSTLRTNIWYAAGDVDLVTVQKPTVTRTQLG